MLNRENIDYVQSAIGYHFKNERLLVQAFIRKSYSQEHPEVQNNEVLEFYGDEALDLYITKMMYKKFSKDCAWDFKVIDKVCETMLSMDSMNSYLCVLVLEKCHELGFGEPENIPRLRQPQTLEDMRPHNWWEVRIGCEQGQMAPDPKTGLYEYGIRINDKFFSGTGIGPFQAKMAAECKALNYLCHEEIKRKIKKVDYSNPVSQLHEFVQKQIIMEPIYDFSEYHDSDGNPIWRCTVSLEGIPKSFTSEDVSKKEVKQEAALQLLNFFIETEIEESKGWETPVFYTGGVRFWSDEMKEEMKKS